MPVSVVVGGQFGSEGKGKTALEIVRRARKPALALRVGGPNSGHTVYNRDGRKFTLRQLPGACVDGDVDVVLPSGTYIDPELLLAELELIKIPTSRVFLSAYARVIRQEHRDWEKHSDLQSQIGSTGSGVGGAVMAAVARGAANFSLPSIAAEDEPNLRELVRRDIGCVTRRALDGGARVVVEGTQGYGLSLLESGYWPKVTSRPTTASAALSEAGLSPMDVDDVTMVIRSFPIRVAGNSGNLPNETSWEAIAELTGREESIAEYTTVTQRTRRVGRFDPEVVIHAINANQPSRLVMNHLDYIGNEEEINCVDGSLRRFIGEVEMMIGRKIDWLGFSPLGVRERGFD